MKLTSTTIGLLLSPQRVTAQISRLSFCARLLVALLALLALDLRAANIVWVSDTPNSNGTAIVSWNTTTPITGTNQDDSFIALLQGAGHNVVRFTADDATTTLLTAGDIAALNTNDLIILGRAMNSGFSSGAQGTQWNTNVTKPMIVQSVYLTRSANLGWFGGSAVPNGSPMPLTATASNAKAAYLLNLFGPSVNGLTTVGNYDEALLQNTSQTTDNPVTGGVVLATGNGTNKVIVEFPAGTAVRGGPAAGYRLFFASGNREGSSAPSNSIFYAGTENLTPTGEQIFLRAVTLAVNNGVVPNTGSAPVITQDPVDTSVCVGLPLVLTSAATGENPLYFQWFSNSVAIPAGTNATYTVASFQTSDAGSYYVVVSNAVGGLSSAQSATATVSVSGTGTVVTAIANATNCPGDSATFTASATGSGTLQYTWYKFGTNVVQATSGANTYTINPVSASDAGTYSVAVQGDCNTATNSFTLTVVGAPSVATQPQNQVTGVGNGATFTVSATATGATPTYQWQTNGVDVTGANGTSFSISNLSATMNGTQVRAIANTCAGSATSQIATLTVIIQSGISFDFDTPNQFTNLPYYQTFNNWINNGYIYPSALYERNSGGVGAPPGSGALELPSANGTDNSSIMIAQNFDFSLPGKSITASTMFKFKTPVTAGRRATQLSFLTTTNYGVNDNNPQGFMSVILQSPTANSPVLEFRTQRRSSGGGLMESVFTQATLTPSNWYRLTATFVNTRTVGVNSNFTIMASLQDMGPQGTTPGTTNLSFTTTTNAADITLFRQVFLAIRGFEDGGVDLRDTTYVYLNGGPIFFVQEPQSQSVVQGQRAMFRAYVDGEGPYSYQWYKDGNPIAGAKSFNYFPIVTTADDGAQYSVQVTGPDATVITSSPATLDIIPLALGVASAGSVDGTTVGLTFNQPVDPATAENPANYTINGVAPVSAQVFRTSVGPRGNDGIYVLLTPASIVSGAFTVNVSGVQDLAGNVISGATSANGQVAGLTGVDINSSTFPPGFGYSFGPGEYIVGGGGTDIWSNNDQFHYLYTTKTGDFDVIAHVPYLDNVRTTSKAGINVRPDLSTFSPMINVAANPMGNLPTGPGNFGRSYIEGAIRSIPNVAQNVSFGNNTIQSYPNVWLRVRRSGNTFIRYSSTNGVNWVLDGQAIPNPVFPDTVYFGLAVASVNNDLIESAQYENVGDFAGYSGATISITTQPSNPASVAAGASVTISGLAAAATGGGISQSSELTYTWQRSDGGGNWTNMPTAGQTNQNNFAVGTVYFSDNGAQYRAVLSAPGALSVTSSVVTITVTDSAVPTVTSTVNGSVLPYYPISEVVITFSEPVASASALNTANYAVTNASGVKLTVTSVEFLNGDPRTVIVKTAEPLGTGTASVGISGVRDLNNNLLATVTRTFRTFGAPGGPVVEEYFADVSGTVSTLVITNFYTNEQPTWIVYSNIFGANVAINGSTFPGNTYSGGTVAADNYGIRAYTHFVAPSNGLYKFWIRSDDGMRLYMNTNSTDILIPTSRNCPDNQDVARVMDGNVNTKYLNFDKVNTGFTVTRQAGAIVQGLRFTTAGDAPERDPLTYTLEGTTADPRFGPWTLIASGDTGFTNGIARLTRAEFIPVANSTSYTAYRLKFPTIRNSPTAANSMQIAEVEFLDANTNKVLFGPQLIAENTGANGNYTVGTTPANSITNIFLTGGRRYYMEALMKEGSGSDGFSVMWTDTSSGTAPTTTTFIPYANLEYPALAASVQSPVKVITEMYLGYLTFASPGNPNFNALPGIADATNFPTSTYLGDVVNFKYISGQPDNISYQKYFGMQPSVANTRYDGYLGKAYSYFVAPSNGVYKFWLRVDDVAVLYMNTNGVNSTDPTGKSFLGASKTPFQSGGPYMLMASNVTLNAGQKYYTEVLWKEGTGGDGFALVVRNNADSSQPSTAIPSAIPDTMLEFPTNISRSGAVNFDAIRSQNGDLTFADGEAPVLVAAGLKGAPPYMGFSWYKNGVKILDNSYTNYLPPVTMADNGAVYTLVVTNFFSRAERSAVMTVTADSAAPTIVSTVGSRYGDAVAITFSEPVDPLTGTFLGNYVPNNGLRLLDAQIDRSGRMVVFSTSQQTPGVQYTITVNGVKDRSSAGNMVAPNTLAMFSGWTIGGNNAFMVEIWTNIVGSTIPDLTGYGKFIANQPDVTYYTNNFGIGTFNANNGLENYGGRVSGYFVPTNSTYYKFFMASDDQSQFFMNVNGPNTEDPAGRSLLIHVPGASQGFTNVNAQSQPVFLNAGQRYYMEALLKEGTGGDYVKVTFRQTDANGAWAGFNGSETAVATDVIGGAYGGGVPGNPDVIQITGIPPSDLFVEELQPVSLELAATIPLSVRAVGSLQWQKSAGAGTFTNIPGANNLIYGFTAHLEDDGSQYRLLASFPGLSNVYVTTLHVSADTTGPVLVGAGSTDGKSLVVRFNEPVDLIYATDPLSYDIDGAIPVTLTSVNGGLGTRLADEKTIVFTLDTSAFTLPATFTANAYGIPNQAASPVAESSSIGGSVVYMTPMEVGIPGTSGAGQYNAANVGYPGTYLNNSVPTPTVFPDSALGVTNNGVDVTASGWDIWNNNDGMHFDYRLIAGDFDIKVRVESIIPADQWSKAGLMARSALTNSARNVFIGATATNTPILSQAPVNNYVAQWRDAEGGASASFNSTTNPPSYPNTWLRLKRTGSVFQGMISSNGTDWVVYNVHDLGPTFPALAYVGLASTSHDQTRGLANNAQISYRDIYYPLAPTITTQPTPSDLTVPIHQDVTFSGLAASGVGPYTYQWQKDGVSIQDATNASLTVTNTRVVDSGVYNVIVGNDGGGVVSSNLTLVVSNALPVVATDTISVDQNTGTNINTALLLGNDNDPEGDSLTILGVSGVAPVTYSADFNSGSPVPGMTIYPVSTVLPNGGDGDSGYLQLNSGAVNLSGAAVIGELTPLKRVQAFTASFKVRISEVSAQPADGMSFNFGPDLPDAVSAGAENGLTAQGFSFGIDNYQFVPLAVGAAYTVPGGGTANTSGVKINYGGIIIAGVQTPTWNSTRWIPITITVSASGVANVIIDGTNALSNVVLPGYAPKTGRFGFYSRTGGQSESHGVDDLSITVMTLDTAATASVNGTLYGNAYYGPNGANGSSGALHINDALASQAGSFILNDLNAGAPVTGFTANFNMRVGGGTAEPADGFSFNFAGDLPNAATTPFAAEAGGGTGFTFYYDSYRFLPAPVPGSPNGAHANTTATTSGMGIVYNGTNIIAVQTPTWVNTAYVPVSISVSDSGVVNVTVDGTNVFGAVQLPNYTPSAGRFGFYGRTGGATETHWIDDLVITSTATNGPNGYFANDFNSTGPGTVSLSGNTVVYSPGNLTCGNDAFYYLASDNQQGGAVWATVNVTVSPTNGVAPTISCPASFTIMNVGSTFALPDIRGGANATGNCISISQSPLPGTVLGAGPHTVTLTVTDANNAQQQCQTTVTFTEVPTAVPLFITQSGPNVVIQWVSTPAHTLYESSDLSSPANWVPSSATVNSSGGTNTATIPATDAAKFYQLK